VPGHEKTEVCRQIDLFAQLFQVLLEGLHLVVIAGSRHRFTILRLRLVLLLVVEQGVPLLHYLGHGITPQFGAGVIQHSGNQPVEIRLVRSHQDFEGQPPGAGLVGCVLEEGLDLSEGELSLGSTGPVDDRLDRIPQVIRGEGIGSIQPLQQSGNGLRPFLGELLKRLGGGLGPLPFCIHSPHRFDQRCRLGSAGVQHSTGHSGDQSQQHSQPFQHHADPSETDLVHQPPGPSRSIARFYRPFRESHNHCPQPWLTDPDRRAELAER